MPKLKELFTFYEEVPVRGKGTITGSGGETLEWRIEGDAFRRALSYSGEFFEKSGGRIYKYDVVYVKNGFASTTKAKLFYDPRFERERIRVATSFSMPVEAEIKSIYDLKGEFKKYPVMDVSEAGIGVLAPKDDFLLVEGKEVAVRVKMFLNPVSLAIQVKGKVVKTYDLDEESKRAGIFFVSLDSHSRDALCRYVLARQKEIIRSLKT